MMGPAIIAPEVSPVQVPIALACAAPRKLEVIRASEDGTSIAPATPCSRRPAMRTSADGAIAISTEVRAKPMSPARMTRMRP